MSLPSLPTELIQQIIESSVPSTYHTSTYRERTSTIYALCLVSRRFRLIAQPILGEIVVLDWSAGVGCAMQSRIEEVKQWDAVRQVVVSLYNHDDMLKLVVASCPKVHELTINYHSAKDDFGLLSHLSELRDLHIFSQGESLRRFQPFKSLRSFTLGWYRGNTLNLQDLLCRSNFPALRALALSHLHVDLLGILRAPSTLQLIETLDALCISIDDHPVAILRVLDDSVSSTLRTSSIDQVAAWASTFTQPINLCLRDPPDEDFAEMEEDADCKKLAKIVEFSTNLPLLSLYLDVSLRPPFGNTSSMEAEGLKRLVEACEKRKVEVVYETAPADWTQDPIISQEFWRRQRELKKAA